MIKGSIHEAVKPLCWLLGKWKSVSAKGYYPTINPFTYCEEITFTTIGQPMLNYNSWHPTENKPMHLESGFLRIKPGTNEVAFMVAHNFGLTTVEEGTVEMKTLNVCSNQIGRISFAKDPAVVGTERTYSINEEGKLEFIMLMETENIGKKEHLRVLYEKVE